MVEPRGDGRERARLREISDRRPWRRWGPYLGERSWGTVREDYSKQGDAWSYFPHDHARSRAYRWSEDGLAGVSDDRQLLCLALAFWNGRDPIIKERVFGVSGLEGNHGEDAKEHWWYLDATPTFSWMRWRYVYPQAAFPYSRLVDENRRRTRDDREFELADSGVLDTGYWEITADYAKADPDDLLLRVTVRNAGHVQDSLDVLPTLWFRNTWSWGLDDRRPVIRAGRTGLVAEHFALGRRVLTLAGDPELLCCENEDNAQRLWGMPSRSRHPKDAVNDHVVHGAPTENLDRTGTKAAARYHLTIPAGGAAELRFRMAPETGDLEAGFSQLMRRREEEADEFYRVLTPAEATADEALILRQALAGLLWNRQLYHFDVRRWLDGDPSGPPPPPERLRTRHAGWRHFEAADVVCVPDKWEYPWCAAWDLAFQCVATAHVDPEFAKDQLILLLREWYMHPSGQLPAQEWGFSSVNPPVHAWAALRVWEIDGRRDRAFLERVLHKLLLNFTWWVNRKDNEGNSVFDGGFLGIDNIGALDRSSALSRRGLLEQSDGMAWMALYCSHLLELALTLAVDNPAYEDLAIKFFEHFTRIAAAIDEQGLWDAEDGFYYDVLRLQDGTRIPVRARSVLGMIPLCAVTVLSASARGRLPGFAARMERVLTKRPSRESIEHLAVPGEQGSTLLSIVDPHRLRRILARLLDEGEFLSPFGLRSLSRAHRDHPLGFRLGDVTARLDYEPGESRTGLRGGNTNWGGPVWFPLNYLLLDALRSYHAHLGEGWSVECPTGSGRLVTLIEVVEEIQRRLLSIFELDPEGRRPVFDNARLFQQRPWRDQLLFYEYFHGETGAGLGASHQTGWTALVADLVLNRRPARVEPPRKTP